MKKEIEDWLKKAEKDLDDGIFNFDNDRRELAAFLFHQSVEKALKAIQIKERGSHKFSHDLIALSNESSRKEFKELFKNLNPVYTGFRYPDVDMGEIGDLERIRNETEEFIKWTKKLLKE